MNSYVKNEEVTALGDFVFTSYERDFDAIKNRFATMNAAFRDSFVAKLDFVKVLESSLVLTENQKGITASLYADAKLLNEELNFLNANFADAGLNTRIISDLKRDLHNSNIEGAILQLEALKQFVTAHKDELIAKDMPADFVDTLDGYKAKLASKNKIQNEIMDNRKMLTDKNIAHYDELKKMLKRIMRNGKLVFKGTVTEDQYALMKVVQRMRAAKRKKEEEGGGTL
ncbi:hypothetical protein [Flavobacterium sp. N1994]|uniref:hypothetical protein n=1 Tax=Flavobacterium sp. N1994 TaxID=2986827 RepID=UPI0022214E24|nr:hypothetical protein [Flavobacterium sp. N1994]